MITIDTSITASIQDIHESSIRRDWAVEIPLKVSMMRQLVHRNSSEKLWQLKHWLPEGHRFGKYMPLPVRPSYWVPREYEMLREEIELDLVRFQQIQKFLFERANAEQVKEWIEPHVNTVLFLGAEKGFQLKSMTVWDISSEFYRMLMLLMENEEVDEWVSFCHLHSR